MIKKRCYPKRLRGGCVYIAGNQVCMKRGLDAEKLKRYFTANNCRITSDPAEADLIVAITCAFVQSYAYYAIAMLRKLLRYDRRMIVLGCLPRMFPKEFHDIFSGEWLSVKDLDRLDHFFPEFTVSFSSMNDSNFADPSVMMPFSPNDSCPTSIRNGVRKGRTFGPIIRNSEGCNNKCSYCSHPFALGPFRSKPLDECLRECKRLVKNGYRTISVHANDPAAYGIDIGLTYPDLIRKLFEIAPVEVKFALPDIGPKWLIKYDRDLTELLHSDRISTVAIPLQSGSPRILKLMHRPFAVEKMAAIVNAFREVAPNISITTHLISGFPTETELDRKLTVDFVSRLNPSKIYVFRYSPNPSTPAARLTPQFTVRELKERQKTFVESLCKATTAKVEAFT